MLHHISLLLGQEHLQAGQPAPAQVSCRVLLHGRVVSPLGVRWLHLTFLASFLPCLQRLLTEVAVYYRRQGWQSQLATALLLLRDCAQQLEQPALHAACSLEAAALGSTLDVAQRQAIAGAALMTLLAGSAAEQEGLSYAVETADSGWLSILALSCGFLQPGSCSVSGSGGTGSSVTPEQAGPGPAVFAVGLWNNLPMDLPLAGVELTLRDHQGTFSVPLGTYRRDGSSSPAFNQGSSSGGGGGTGGGGAPEHGARVNVPQSGWLRLSAEVAARCSGSLQATVLTLHLGPSSSLDFKLGGLLPAAGATAVGLLQGSYESGVLPFSAATG